MNAAPQALPPPAPASRRWLVPAALFVSVVIAYLDRLNIAMAITAIGRDFGWTTEELGENGGMLISLFFVGYGLANIFLTPLAARYGPRVSLMIIVVLFSCFTMLGAPLSFSLAAFAFTRFMLGVAEGVHFPMMSTVTKRWFPLHERSRANGIWIAGVMAATIGAPILLVPAIHWFGWKAMFIGLGFLGMLVTLPVLYFFVYDSPEDAPFVGPGERAYIAGLREPDAQSGDWAFLRNYLFWIALLAGVLNNFCAFGIIMWLPTYFTEGRGIPFEDLSYAASLPYAIGFSGIVVSAWLGDWLQQRALQAGIGFFCAAIFVGLAMQSEGMFLLIACFSAAVFSQTFYTAQEYAILQRILPHRGIGQGTGVYNGVAMLAGGGLGTYLIGNVVSVSGNFGAGMYLIMGAAAGAGATLIILSRIIRY